MEPPPQVPVVQGRPSLKQSLSLTQSRFWYVPVTELGDMLLKRSLSIIYSCTSSYPAAIEDVKLLDILNIKKKYGKFIKAIGFSGHHRGLSIDNAAISLGASWFERHFTFDRAAKGTDHAASLETEGLMKLRIRLDETNMVLNYKPKKILKNEKFQRKYLKKIVRI